MIRFDTHGFPPGGARPAPRRLRPAPEDPPLAAGEPRTGFKAAGLCTGCCEPGMAVTRGLVPMPGAGLGIPRQPVSA